MRRKSRAKFALPTKAVLLAKTEREAFSLAYVAESGVIEAHCKWGRLRFSPLCALSLQPDALNQIIESRVGAQAVKARIHVKRNHYQ